MLATTQTRLSSKSLKRKKRSMKIKMRDFTNEGRRGGSQANKFSSLKGTSRSSEEFLAKPKEKGNKYPNNCYLRSLITNPRTLRSSTASTFEKTGQSGSDGHNVHIYSDI
ncbi:hypothetical protein L6164_030690 [Bauhinia variegata]|uniref:Uncharacterized protein n=1 Tax=Bauhinia variegata TaxID=167791 RepID=A0ACB9LDK1_BAUVA|nr:hypothetical protein L6164_030690 [Bauhinia variegata]